MVPNPLEPAKSIPTDVIGDFFGVLFPALVRTRIFKQMDLSWTDIVAVGAHAKKMADGWAYGRKTLIPRIPDVASFVNT